jgi:Gpi18-like mannosyltransferase
MVLLSYILVCSVVLSAPVILAIIVGRHRINPAAGCALLAAWFFAASAYIIWRMEWFDVWRHGTPRPSLLFGYACYSAAYGVIGWVLGKAILPRRVRHGTTA